MLPGETLSPVLHWISDAGESGVLECRLELLAVAHACSAALFRRPVEMNACGVLVEERGALGAKGVSFAGGEGGVRHRNSWKLVIVHILAAGVDGVRTHATITLVDRRPASRVGAWELDESLLATMRPDMRCLFQTR